MSFWVMVLGGILTYGGFEGDGKTIDQRHQYEIIAGLVLVGIGALLQVFGNDG